MKAALPAALLALALSACVPAAKAPPAPAAAPSVGTDARPAVPVLAAAVSPTIAAAADGGWIDAAITAGGWRYAGSGGRSEASFWSPDNRPMLRLRCESARGTIVLSQPESGAPRPLATVRTESLTRTFQTQPAGRETLLAFDPRDPLLDAIALSKGRFAIETDGLPNLILPTWAEVSRVIEDCR